MNRKYTMEQFREKVGFIHRYLPGWAITTDIIVGFPGETEDDFASTLNYVETGVFSNAFTFIYSIRRGTPAARWEQVPGDVSAFRFKRLCDAQNAATRAYHERKIGTIARALVCGPSKKDPSKLATKTTDNVTVIAPKPPSYDEALYAREPWLDIDIETAHVWGCTGSILRRAERYDSGGTPVQRAAIDLLAL
jgi:tRNA-2-methylthio-N6-dimethylallyladenosine synthase